MKKIMTLFLLILIGFSPIFAATSANLAISVDVASISQVTFTNAGAGTLADPATVANSEVTVGTITCDNNNPAGFSLTLSSTNSGKFKRSGGSTNTGDLLDYTITVSDTGSGTRGTDAPTLPSNVSLASNQVINFNTNPVKATYDKTYLVKVSTAQNRNLFRGTFSDTITVQIADL